MEDDNLLAEVNISSVIRMERNLWSGVRMTDSYYFDKAVHQLIIDNTKQIHYICLPVNIYEENKHKAVSSIMPTLKGGILHGIIFLLKISA